MKKSMFLICALMASAAFGGEFYRLNLKDLAPGSEIVKTNTDGKQSSLLKAWGMWPREANTVGAVVTEVDGVKALQIKKGIQLNSSEWSMASNDAQQSVIYARVKVMVKEAPEGVVTGAVMFQQVNGRSAAFIGLLCNKGKTYVSASNGDGKGYVKWVHAGEFKLGEWTTVDVKMDFVKKVYDVSVNGSEALKDNKFRHAEAWEGTMWAKSVENKDYRYDIKADNADVFVSEIAFSADPVEK